MIEQRASMVIGVHEWWQTSICVGGLHGFDLMARSRAFSETKNSHIGRQK